MDQHRKNLRLEAMLIGAAHLAVRFHTRNGFSQGSATLTVLELFPEFTEEDIKEANGWEFS